MQWQPKPAACNATQYQTQSCGLEESLVYIAEHLNQCPHDEAFDGIVGFSQGAAVAAAVAEAQSKGRFPEAFQFRFFILCSGYPPQALKVETPIRGARRLVEIPTLHVFGSAERDRQIPQAASESLASLFRDPVVHRHSFGHIIPIQEESILVYRKFLRSFLDPSPSFDFVQ
ncbi:Rhodanese-like domain-containing protein 6 [Porphyridium purpureum]|uniref:Rhodanese-like domain-containing protein 6 n=1 Tax=Porphyridium purpureum TaxID=35688 RepID=A0A5J4Z8T6_PORPP|nr:Rhodanese-like domain-containing protein 6 [Porphyridium purpureum]|eukprot:POR1637..scf295_1